uniref:AIR synthase n=1 Tax=Thermofilum pendens TaxID=2269 RepID=A0A7C4BAT6_THEPE
MARLKLGKLEWAALEKLLRFLPVSGEEVLVGPGVGEDAAVIKVGEGFLVAHVDPITAAAERVGYLAVHIAANDVAVRGVKPSWFMPTVLLPEGAEEELAERVFRDMAQALRELGGVAVGGHTEVSPGISKPIVVMAAMGYTSGRVVLTSGAKPGELVIAAGRLGGEGAGVIAWDFAERLRRAGIPAEVIERARGFVEEISAVKAALTLKDYASSMHDPTEGGFLQALREVALASGVSIRVDLRKVALDPVVRVVTSAVGVDPLKLLSSGSVVATVPKERAEEAVQALRSLGIPCSVVGAVEDGPRGLVILESEEGESRVEEDIVDEIYRLWQTAHTPSTSTTSAPAR